MNGKENRKQIAEFCDREYKKQLKTTLKRKKKVLLLKQLKTNSINSIVAYKFFETLDKAKEFSIEHRFGLQKNEFMFMIVFDELQEMRNDKSQ